MSRREAQALIDAALATQEVIGYLLVSIHAAEYTGEAVTVVSFTEDERRALLGVRIGLRGGLLRLGERVAINPALDVPR